MRASKAMILKHLKTFPFLTSKEAFELYGITRISARIKELRDMGYDIETVMVEGTTRFGESCRYARYVLKGEPNEQNTKNS